MDLPNLILPIFIAFSLVASLSSADFVYDYCVGDLSVPTGASGYTCKDPAKVTIDDFVFSGLRVPGNTTNTFKFGASAAFAPQFPALNGMGISMVRADMGVGGAVPIHTHRVAELLILVEGTLIAGFIDTNNIAYYKTLHKGDIIIIPPQVLHFQANVGSIPTVAYASFASENPGTQSVDALFQGNLPSEVVERVTLLDHAQVKKLKKLLGGSN